MMRAVSLVALLGLAACGNQGGSVITGALKGVVGGMVSRGGDDAQAAAAAAPSDDDLRSLAENSSALRVSVPKFGTVGGAVPVGVNGPKVTWVAGGATLTTQSGFLLATRGLPGDLMAVEVEGFGEAFKPGGGVYSRQMEFLDGRDQIQRLSFVCTVSTTAGQTVTVLDKSYPTTLYEDVCVGEKIQFTNQYWVDGTRKLRQTRQWVSETVGYLQTQQL